MKHLHLLVITEQLPIVDMNLCGTTGEEDDGGVGGRRPGSPLCGSAEGGSGGSGLSGLPAGPGCTSPWPLPHQGGLQPDWYVYCDEGQSRLQHLVVLNILLLPQTCSFHHRRQTRKTQTRTNFTSFCAFLNCDSNKFCHYFLSFNFYLCQKKTSTQIFTHIKLTCTSLIQQIKIT